MSYGLSGIPRTQFLEGDVTADFIIGHSSLLWSRQMQFHLAPLYFGGGRNLKDGYLRTSADKTETICMATPHKGMW